MSPGGGAGVGGEDSGTDGRDLMGNSNRKGSVVCIEVHLRQLEESCSLGGVRR